MANMHLKEAANNVRKAVDDLRLLMQQTKADAMNAQRDIEQRVKSIATERDQLNQGMMSTDSTTSKAQHAVLIKKLDDERKQLEQQLNEIHTNIARQTHDLDKQAYEFDSLAKRLDMMA